MPKFKVITIFKTFFFFTQICVMTFLKKGQEKEAGEHRKCESPTNVVSLASKSDCWPEHGRTYSESKGADPPKADLGVLVPGTDGDWDTAQFPALWRLDKKCPEDILHQNCSHG